MVITINGNFLNLMVMLWLYRRMSLLEVHARLSGVMSGMMRLQNVIDNLFSNGSEEKSSLYCTRKCRDEIV